MRRLEKSLNGMMIVVIGNMMKVQKSMCKNKHAYNIDYLPAGIIAKEMISLYLKTTAQAQIPLTNPAGR